jgi:hypothetical protein
MGAVLCATQVQSGGLKFHIGPLKLTKFAGAKAMTEADQDHGGVTLAVPVFLNSCYQLLDFTFCQMLARPQFFVA